VSDRFEVVVALLTPFGDSGRVDAGALAAHVHLLAEASVDGVMPCGTTGEGPLLALDEATAVIRETVHAADGRVRVVAHVSRASTAETVELARAAIADGVQAVSAIVPYYFAYTDDQIVRHFASLIEAADGVPVYAYALPSRTQNELSPGAVERLRPLGLQGVKDSTKSLERLQEYVGTGVDVLVGTDGFVLEAMRAGAVGCVSAIANVRPELLCAIRDGAGESAQDAVSRLREAFPTQRLKPALAGRLPGYPVAYRPPLG
jgi:4-hydroxy-tetrahydrodipicolinate synthase